jgi:GT2 family glycosyltransferase
MDKIDLSVIIVNYNVPEDVGKCILSLNESASGIVFEVIVVDNNSVTGNIDDALKGLSNVHLLKLGTNNGFGYACNQGMNIARAKYILLSNPDIVYEEDAVGKLYRFLESEPGAGAAGPVQTKPGTGIERYYSFFPDLYSRTMQENRLYMKAPLMKYRFNDFWDENIKKNKPFKVDWVMGSCLMIRTDIYRSIGGFDEAFFFV